MHKLHKRRYKSRFISNLSPCSTTILSKHITSTLTAVKEHVMKYSETALSNSNVKFCWSNKKSSEVIEKLRLRHFQCSQVSPFDFSTLYTSVPHDLITAKALSLVNWCFNGESKYYLCTSLKVIRHVFGFGIEFRENKDIVIFGYFILIDFIKWYCYHTYFSPISTS